MNYTELAEDHDALEFLGEDEAYESSNRRRRRPAWSRPSQPYRVPPINRPQAVSPAQVDRGFERVAQDVSRTREGIEEMHDRVASVSKRSQTTLARLQAELKQTREMAAILPLLSRPESVELTENVTSTDADGKEIVVLKKGERLARTSDDTLSMLLPMLLLGGLGGSSSTANGAPAQDNNSMMMMVLVLALSGRK